MSLSGENSHHQQRLEQYIHMKHHRIRSILICLLIILLALVILFLRGDFGSIDLGFIKTYPNSDKYQSGGTSISQKVEKIDISWISGKVNIISGKSNEITFSETSPAKLNEQNSLHYWVDGTTLRIRPNGPGFNINLPSKELTLELPEGFTADTLKIEVVSADMEVTGIKADRLEIHSTSGSLEAELSTGELSAETVSGNVSVSGDKTKQVKVNTISGDVSLAFRKAPSNMQLDSVSGDMTVQLPSDTEFTLGVSTVSGNLDSEFAVVHENNKYICGDGENNYQINTVSGDIRLKAE